MHPLPSLASARRHVPAAGVPECVPSYRITDQVLSPQLQPGDLLTPVTCRTRPPLLGEYVLITGEFSGFRVARFISGHSSASNRLVWSGREYLSVPAEHLRGRILTVQRGGRTFDLEIGRGWPGRNLLIACMHRLLAPLHQRLRSRA